MLRVMFGHANQATSRPSVHEEVLGELLFLLKSNHGTVTSQQCQRAWSNTGVSHRAENRKFLDHDRIPN